MINQRKTYISRCGKERKTMGTFIKIVVVANFIV